MSGRPDSGTALMPSRMVWLPSASRMCEVVPPIRPTIIGSTTVRANWQATAASMALPPAASISRPAADASGWLVTTMPLRPCADCFSHVKCVPARSRQLPLPTPLSPARLVGGDLGILAVPTPSGRDDARCGAAIP
jgi:hypothetical protein